MMEKQPPKQIYLQAYDSDSYDDNTWCSDKQNEDDIEYILQSEYDQLKSENERLQKYKEKLISDATQNEFVLLAYHDSLKEMKARVQELEQERDYLDGRCAALENDLVLDDVVSKLENVQTRLADFENMARAFVEYKAPDHICRMHFDLMLKESEE